MKMTIIDLEAKSIVFQGDPKTEEEIGEVNRRWSGKKYRRHFL